MGVSLLTATSTAIPSLASGRYFQMIWPLSIPLRGQTKVKSSPGIHEVLLGTGGSRQAGPLSHGLAIGRSEAQDALQPLSDAGSTGFNEEAIVTIHQQVLNAVELGDHNGKT